MSFSIYTSLYLIKKNNFPFIHHLSNFSKFAGDDGEVVIATCQDGIVDGTDQIILDYIKTNNLNNVKLVVSDTIKFSQNTFDGDLKNFALQNTKYPIKIQMDGDEAFILSQRDKWVSYSNGLLNSGYQAMFIPSIDLYGSPNHIRKNNNIGLKWRVHKEGLKRGVVNFAKKSDGKILTTMSDTCELIDENNQLVQTARTCPDECLYPDQAYLLKHYLYTLHFGYLDLQYRKNINENWWKEKWQDRSGLPENVVIDMNILQNEEVVEHNLPID